MPWLKLLAKVKLASLTQLQCVAPLDYTNLATWEKEHILIRQDVPKLDGSMQSVFALGRRGAELVSLESGKDVHAIPYFTPARFKRSLFTLEHELAITQIGLCLEILTKMNDNFKLLLWETAPQRVWDKRS